MSDDEDAQDEPASADAADMNVGLLAQIAIEYIKFGNHVSEVYSPERVTKLARKHRLTSGFSIDLREVDPDTNKPWDLTDPEIRAKVRYRVQNEKPLLLIGSPPCTAFSQLFMSNCSRIHG